MTLSTSPKPFIPCLVRPYPKHSVYICIHPVDPSTTQNFHEMASAIETKHFWRIHYLVLLVGFKLVIFAASGGEYETRRLKKLSYLFIKVPRSGAWLVGRFWSSSSCRWPKILFGSRLRLLSQFSFTALSSARLGSQSDRNIFVAMLPWKNPKRYLNKLFFGSQSGHCLYSRRSPKAYKHKQRT